MAEDKELTAVFEQQKTEFLELFDKIDKSKPDSEDIQKAEAMIRRNPHVWEIGMGVAGSIVKTFLDKTHSGKSQQLIAEAEALSIKERLGYNASNQIEKLVIDQVLFCWAGVNYVEYAVFSLLTDNENTAHST